MNERANLLTRAFTATVLAATTLTAAASGPVDDGNFCMDVEIQPFHMMPGYESEEGACAVPAYWGGELQAAFYPFTIEDHLFNCEVSGDVMPLSCAPDAPMVPTSVRSEGQITGTIDGHSFSATLYCASLTNYYEQFCENPCDPDATCFQLAQPFLKQGLPFPRVTEVSVLDGVITVEKGKKAVQLPIVMATRAAGITHLEAPPELVGASVTHTLLGMVAYEEGDGEVEDARVLEGSADLLLQGHIFSPDAVEDDPGAAVIKGVVCSEDLYKLVNEKGKKKAKKKGRGDDDD